MSTLRYVIEVNWHVNGIGWTPIASFFDLATAIQLAEMNDFFEGDLCRLRDTRTDELLNFRDPSLQVEADKRLNEGEGLGYIKPRVVT